MKIRINNLNSVYEDRPCLQKIDLEISSGQIFALIGPNGCGKTTMLRHISGVIQTPETGRAIQLDMRTLASFSAPELAKMLGAVEQHIHPGFDFCVRDVVSLGRIPHLRRWQSLGTRDLEVVEQVLQQTSLVSLADRSVFALSSGERQRVWLAMALAQEPQILLLDEPTSHLDLCFQIEMFEILRSLTSQGMTVVISIHDINLTLLYVQQVALMKAGRVVVVGDPATVFTRENIDHVFAIDMRPVHDPQTGRLVGLLPSHKIHITSQNFLTAEG